MSCQKHFGSVNSTENALHTNTVSIRILKFPIDVVPRQSCSLQCDVVLVRNRESSLGLQEEPSSANTEPRMLLSSTERHYAIWPTLRMPTRRVSLLPSKTQATRPYSAQFVRPARRRGTLTHAPISACCSKSSAHRTAISPNMSYFSNMSVLNPWRLNYNISMRYNVL
jgi:hypothetical protein